MIAILAVLLHNGAIEAADLLCTPVDHQTESCTLTQAPTTRQAVQNYYQHSSSTASCLEHVDNMQVPSNKSSMLRASIIRMQQMLRAQRYDRIPALHHTPVPDLHYYVFGLRKIIV